VTYALRLPMFEIEGVLEGQADADSRQAEDLRSRTVLLKRATLIVKDGTIEHVLYPVFPPDRNAGDVLEWMEKRVYREIR
jgi:hypothetical protein